MSYPYNITDHGSYMTFDNGTVQHDFHQVFTVFPSLGFLYPFKYENEFNGYAWAERCASTMWIPLSISVIYFVLIFAVQAYMKDKQPYDLKKPLAAWNLLLATFSFIGVCRTLPHFLINLTHGFHYSLCTPAAPGFGFSASGLWIGLFIYSKIPELFDTAFIVLRKKPLIFLHWYHHITVLLFCWHGFGSQSSAGFYFIVMNYCVHSVMYAYYFLMAINARPAWMKPIFITVMQLSQMALGIVVCASTYYYKVVKGEDDACPVPMDNLYWGSIMYASYFALFLEFLLKRFVFRSMGTGKTVKDTASISAKKAKKVE